MTLDTRAKRREPVSAAVEYAMHDAAGTSVKLNLPGTVCMRSSLIDISVLGCAIDSQYLIPPGVVLDLKVDRSPFLLQAGENDKYPMSILGMVKSCVMKAQGRYRLGILFAKSDKKDIALIEKFIDAKERRKAPRWDMTK